MFGSRLIVIPPSNKFKHRLSERHGAVAKLMLLNIINELAITEDWEVKYAVAVVFSAKNRLMRKAGFSPYQVVFGGDAPHIAVLTSQLGEGRMKLTTIAATSESDVLQRKEQIRSAAVAAFAWLDAHEKLRVAMGIRSRPPRLVLTAGTEVCW